MQDDCTPENLAAAVLNQFQHPEITGALQPRYRELHETLRQDASARAAEAISTLLRSAGVSR
jgi:lipid-A-disaccharide synthase